MDLVEEVGESSSPPRSYGSFGGGGSCGSGGYDSIKNDVYNRLMEDGHEEAMGNPDFREQLETHFSRLPQSYVLDVNLDRVEDVLLHQKLLARAKDPDNRPVFHVRFLENTCNKDDHIYDEQVSSVTPTSNFPGVADNEGAQCLNDRNCKHGNETCYKFEVLNLDVRKNSIELNREIVAEDFNKRKESLVTPIHEVIFSTIDKPKLLSQGLTFGKLMCFQLLMATL